MRRFAAVVAAGLFASAGFPAGPAGAETDEMVSADPPGFTYTYLADPAGTGDQTTEHPESGATGPAPLASASASSPAPPSAAFSPPQNEDFVFRFAPEVTASKRTAFEAAAGIWSEVLEVEIPIEVSVSVRSFSDPGILGGAAPGDLFANHPAFPEVGVWYVSAQANQFAGRDLDPSFVEVDVLISADYDFYEGVDGRVPPDKVSLMALALHELGHGLGHTTLAQLLADGSGVLDHQGLPLAYDTRVSRADLLPFTDLSPADLGRALIEPTVWNGPEGTRSNGGSAPRLYAPRRFEIGSSISHLDEDRFTSALMTPFLANGEAQTAVPSLTTAMFADFGWGVEARTPSETLVTALSRDFVKRFPSPSQLRRLADELDVGSRTHRQLADAFGRSDEWVGGAVDAYYLTTLGRTADPAGKAHWSQRLRTGTPSSVVASHFFSSSEYFIRSGSTNREWVRQLYLGILGREPDRAGLDAWVAAAERGMTRATIAHAVYQAPESRAKRVVDLYESLLGRAPDAAGLQHWTDRLQNGRDIDLAITLASSREYAERAFGRFG